jgi:hypothetical protein
VNLDIKYVRKIEWPADPNNAMSHLVLPRRDLDIVKALSRRHDRSKMSIWGADFIRGKGEGQIFLLHSKSQSNMHMFSSSLTIKGRRELERHSPWVSVAPKTNERIKLI